MVEEFCAAEDVHHHHGHGHDREGEDASVSAFDSFRNQLVLASSPFSGKLLCVSLASKEVMFSCVTLCFDWFGRDLIMIRSKMGKKTGVKRNWGEKAKKIGIFV